MAKSSIEINNAIRDLEDKVAKASIDFNQAEGDAQAAIHDQINVYNGKLDVYKELLNDALAAEDEVRKNGGIPAVHQHEEKKPLDVASLFLGARDAFDKDGVRFGTRTFSMRDLSDGTHALNDPKKTDYNLPSNIIEMPMGIIDVISKGTTDSNMEYMVPGTFTNGAKQWKPGDEKGESGETWTTDAADLFTIAHWMPVSKHTAKHYGQLESIINNDLLYGLKLKEADALLNLNDGNNKKGILQKTGIQKFTKKAGENLYDSIRRMKTLSWTATGFIPTHVGLHPMLSEHLDLLKDGNGQYMRLNLDGKAWAMPIIEDVNLVTDASSNTKYGAIVFNANAATWYTSETDYLSVGLVDKQFIKNEYTILAEGEHLITVQRPKSFVYLADALGK